MPHALHASNSKTFPRSSIPTLHASSHSRRRRKLIHPETIPSKHLVVVACASSPSSPSSSLLYTDQECSKQGWRCSLRTATTTATTTTTTTIRTQHPQQPIVALGKFDALHRGHRALAIAASQLGGTPWLVSFSGIAAVLGWPLRLPLVAPCDRRRVLQTWAAECGGITPMECAIPFQEVRSLSPEAFIEVLAKDLCVAGVVVGSNYRFGYKAAGTAELLRALAPEHGLLVDIIDLVSGSLQERSDDDGCAKEHDSSSPAVDNDIVSSSRIRHALAEGDVVTAAYCLDRPYRLVVDFKGYSTGLMHFGGSVFNNQPPAAGRYKALLHVAASGWDICHVEQGYPCEIVILDDTSGGGVDIVDGGEGIEKQLKIFKDSKVTLQLDAKLMFDFV